MNKHTLIILLIFCSSLSVVAQKTTSNSNEQTVVLNESSITAIVKALKAYRAQTSKALPNTDAPMGMASNDTSIVISNEEFVDEIQALKQKLATIKNEVPTPVEQPADTLGSDTLMEADLAITDQGLPPTDESYAALVNRVAQLEKGMAERDASYRGADQGPAAIMQRSSVQESNATAVASDERYQNLEQELQKQQVAQLKTEVNRLQTEQSQSISRVDDKNRQVASVEKEIKQLRKTMAQNQRRQRKMPPIIVAPIVAKAAKDTVVVKENEESKLVESQVQADSLPLVLVDSTAIEQNNALLALEDELASLKLQLANQNVAPTTVDNSTQGFGEVIEKIFFDNNSKTVSKEGMQTISQFVKDMKANTTLDIMIQGFASSKGSISANETISLFRTEAVKKALMLQGIHPNRILTQYHGIDYAAKTEADARRAELSYLVSKR